MIKFNTPQNGHYIKAEISLYPNADVFTLFDLMKDIVGYNHILINKEHYIVNTKTHQLKELALTMEEDRPYSYSRYITSLFRNNKINEILLN